MALFALPDNAFFGIKDIDSQHQHLVALINSLHDSLQKGKDRATLAAVLGELLDYTHTHFGYEETLMEKLNYPGYTDHKEKHDILINEVEDLASDFHNSNRDLSMDVFNFLIDWLVDHILQMDSELAGFLKAENKVNVSAKA